MKATPGQIKRIHALLPASLKADKEAKGDLVQRFTGDPAKRSTKDLEVGQAQRLISRLISSGIAATQLTNSGHRMRRKILSICHELDWHRPGTTELDWPRISNFLEKYGHAHKRDLNDYTLQELPTLVTQFERLLKSNYAK